MITGLIGKSSEHGGSPLGAQRDVMDKKTYTEGNEANEEFVQIFARA
jgi:hypothetical protein